MLGCRLNRFGWRCFNGLSHEIDYLSWIFGDVEWVSSWVGNVNGSGDDEEDAFHLILSFTIKRFNEPVIGKFESRFYSGMIRHAFAQ